jgi:putative ABC transport system permease protein
VEPNKIVLTESTSKRYYGSATEAHGKTLRVESSDYVVTAVMEDFPSNSHLLFDFLASFKTHPHGKNPEWNPSNYFSYIKLKEGAELAALNARFEQLIEKYLGEAQKSYGFQSAVFVQPVSEIHLSGNDLRGVKPGSDVKYLYIFGTVALLLIFIGIINYVNLATAEATERNKEVGLRKVLGAERVQLFRQFISESVILTGSALFFSLLVLFLISSNFEQISGVPLQLQQLLSPSGLLGLFGLLLLVSVLSGMYPALILSGVQPLKALGKEIKPGGGVWLRKSLVVFQFFVSIGLLMATMIVKGQLEYMQNIHLGYEREHLISLNTHTRMNEIIPSLKTEMVRTGAATSSALAADMPIYIKAGYSIRAGFDNDKEFNITGYAVDADIFKTIGASIMAGNDFSDQDINRSTAYQEQLELPIVLNEAAVRELGWTAEEAVGKKIDMGGNPARIKGIVADFYFNSLHHQVNPLVVFIDESQTNLLLVKLAKGNPGPHLASLENTWKTLVPDRPFNYKFVDQEYGQMYQSEERVSLIFSLFAGIAIIIACMGLFGLVSYVAQRRTREISIRKVLGATARDVLKLLSSDFFMLLGISAVFAIAFGFWFSKEWTQGFAYKTPVSVWVYALSIVIVAVISFLTIGYRTIKVNMQNPAQTLKDE